MGTYEDAYRRVTRGQRVEDMTPAQLRDAEKRAQTELERLAEQEDHN